MTATGAESSSYFTTREAAAYLKVSPHTIKEWRREGRFVDAYKLGGKLIRYRREDLDAWAHKWREGTARAMAPVELGRAPFRSAKE